MLKQTMMISLFLCATVTSGVVRAKDRNQKPQDVSVQQARTLLRSMMINNKDERITSNTSVWAGLPIGNIADDAVPLFKCSTANDLFTGIQWDHAFAFAERFALIHLPASRTRDARNILVKVDLESRFETTQRFGDGGFQTYRPRSLKVRDVMSQSFAKSLSNRAGLLAQSGTVGADLTSTEPAKLDAIKVIRIVDTGYKAMFHCERTLELNGGSYVDVVN